MRKKPPTHADAAAKVHGGGLVGKLNQAVGLRITTIVGTMWAAYLFTVLALISLPAAIHSADPIIIVAWIAQTFLQLVLLPIIIVGQTIQAKAADARAQATFDDATQILADVQQIQEHLLTQDDVLEQLVQSTFLDHTTIVQLRDVVNQAVFNCKNKTSSE